MTVSSSTSAGGINAADPRDNFKQTRADFQSLTAAVQSGDMSAAQQALAQLQQDNPRLASILGSDPSSSDSARVSDLKSLAAAVKSGDAGSAQQALAKLQQDAQTQAASGVGGHHHHHHHHAASTDDSTNSSSESTTTGTALNATA